MTNKEPTPEQIKEFWEWCGFTRLPKANKYFHYEHGERFMNWLPPGKDDDPLFSIEYLPRLDLNNLFKYAVPKLHGAWAISIKTYVDSDLFHVELIYGTLKYGSKEFKANDKDPALALFWAIWEVIHG